ncbi:MAG: anti-sigma factor antagonist [Candidatus Limivicinus sp.]|jgi:stage II sporulation protein AA (anti-sigma F factor antagonist)
MNIRTAFSAGRLTIFLSGELDHHEARRAIRSINELLDEYLPRDCALELSQLSFMDSSGIAVIIKVNKRMRSLGGRVWIENPSRQPRRVIDAAGIDRLVPVAISK